MWDTFLAVLGVFGVIVMIAVIGVAIGWDILLLIFGAAMVVFIIATGEPLGIGRRETTFDWGRKNLKNMK